MIITINLFQNDFQGKVFQAAVSFFMKVRWDLGLAERQEAYLYVGILVSLFVSQSDSRTLSFVQLLRYIRALSQRGETTGKLADFKKTEHEKDVQRFKGWLCAVRAERSNQEMQT
jgi:hypothetical protein